MNKEHTIRSQICTISWQIHKRNVLTFKNAAHKKVEFIFSLEKNIPKSIFELIWFDSQCGLPYAPIHKYEPFY